MRTYHGSSTVARILGVHTATIRRWLDTYEESPYACPQPEVKIGKSYGWSDAGLVEWGVWYRRYKAREFPI